MSMGHKINQKISGGTSTATAQNGNQRGAAPTYVVHENIPPTPRSTVEDGPHSIQVRTDDAAGSSHDQTPRRIRDQDGRPIDPATSTDLLGHPREARSSRWIRQLCGLSEIRPLAVPTQTRTAPGPLSLRLVRIQEAPTGPSRQVREPRARAAQRSQDSLHSMPRAHPWLVELRPHKTVKRHRAPSLGQPISLLSAIVGHSIDTLEDLPVGDRQLH